MATATRIYVVSIKLKDQPEVTKLVRAKSPAGAIRAVAGPAITAKYAEQDDLIKLRDEPVIEAVEE